MKRLGLSQVNPTILTNFNLKEKLEMAGFVYRTLLYCYDFITLNVIELQLNSVAVVSKSSFMFCCTILIYYNSFYVAGMHYKVRTSNHSVAK